MNTVQNFQLSFFKCFYWSFLYFFLIFLLSVLVLPSEQANLPLNSWSDSNPLPTPSLLIETFNSRICFWIICINFVSLGWYYIVNEIFSSYLHFSFQIFSFITNWNFFLQTHKARYYEPFSKSIYCLCVSEPHFVLTIFKTFLLVLQWLWWYVKRDI